MSYLDPYVATKMFFIWYLWNSVFQLRKGSSTGKISTLTYWCKRRRKIELIFVFLGGDGGNYAGMDWPRGRPIVFPNYFPIVWNMLKDESDSEFSQVFTCFSMLWYRTLLYIQLIKIHRKTNVWSQMTKKLKIEIELNSKRKWLKWRLWIKLLIFNTRILTRANQQDQTFCITRETM